ncbi:glutamate-1-semialdehyde 2,1-aminomutase [Hydromonas duriensis]|uniref:Glutamate-1-semialdehyde 2,1-aminomutase n=1 Tax=Hydromonas duriensis TaxID=1527608 RepID=A0A4R6Y995_9BURK|nr:glutamate-1-semialdehyde 2,1-aminomutase [Hydromonas duriensis]TDR32007.1 glutamate-1-semialdehyde 2,1-aminomutase [Hydromonas duriensis]
MNQNQILFDRASKTSPGGVNSPVRAFRSVGGTPRFIKRAQDAYFWDENDVRYIDYIGSWGPIIVGHAHPNVVKAVQEAAAKGLGFGTPTRAEVEMAELLCDMLPSLEQVRLVSSGTEATMSAIRLARGFTGRDVLVKFEGCYHGHSDSLLVKAGSGLLTLGNPSSAGVPVAVSKDTLVLPYNDVDALKTLFKDKGDTLAAVILEPIAGNMNFVRARPEFMRTLRELCTEYGTVLIIDEVMTGFRVGEQCAQGVYGVQADLTTLGKVIGGGMPVAAFGGRADIMAHMAPLGGVYQAGTLSGNPVAVAAGLATLNIVRQDGFFDNLRQKTTALLAGFSAAAHDAGVPFSTEMEGGMFGLFFSNQAPQSYAEVMASRVDLFPAFFHAMLDEGVYLAPSAFEAGFMSAAHTDEDIASTIAAARKAFAAISHLV